MSDSEVSTCYQDFNFDHWEKEYQYWIKGFAIKDIAIEHYHPFNNIPGFQPLPFTGSTLIDNLHTPVSSIFAGEPKGYHIDLKPKVHEALARVWLLTGNSKTHCPPECDCGGYSSPLDIKRPYCHCTVCLQRNSITTKPSQ